MAYTSAGIGVKGTTVAESRKAIDLLLTRIAAVATADADAIKSASYANNTLSFFHSNDASGTAAYTFNLPEEMFLDQTKTAFVQSFNFAGGSYTWTASLSWCWR